MRISSTESSLKEVTRYSPICSLFGLNRSGVLSSMSIAMIVLMAVTPTRKRRRVFFILPRF